MLETESTLSGLEEQVTRLPISHDAQLTILVNSGRRAFIAEAVGEDQLGDLDLVPAYSPRERIGNILKRVVDSIVNLNSKRVGLSYIFFGVVLFGTTIAVSCYPDLLYRDGNNQNMVNQVNNKEFLTVTPTK